MLKSLCFSSTIKTFIKPVIAYGVLIYGCSSKNRLKSIFILQKKMLRQICSKAGYYTSADSFNEISVLHRYDYYTAELLNFFLESFGSVLLTEYLDSLYDPKVSNDLTRQTQLNLISTANEFCSVCRNSLRYRGEKLINCLFETGFGKNGFLIRIKHKTSKHMHHVTVKVQIYSTVFQ